MVASAQAMQGTMLKVIMIPRTEFGCVLTLQSSAIYQVTVSSLPECNCPTFKEMITKLNRRYNSFFHCKHLYFLFIILSKLDPHQNLFIHAPTFSFNEVKVILEGGVLAHRSS